MFEVANAIFDGSHAQSATACSAEGFRDAATQATEMALHCAEQLQQHVGAPPLPPRAAHAAAAALQHLAAAALPGDKRLRALATKFASLAHRMGWAADAMAAAPPEQVTPSCHDGWLGRAQLLPDAAARCAWPWGQKTHLSTALVSSQDSVYSCRFHHPCSLGKVLAERQEVLGSTVASGSVHLLVFDTERSCCR